MKRREFIALTVGVVAGWSERTDAQQGKRVKLAFVSWRSPAQADDAESLRQGLRDLGYIDGKNIEIESHFTDGNRERTREIIRTLVETGVAILVVRATPVAHIAKELTQTIPVVMIVADPLATGLVKTLAHPGGNLTGLSMFGPVLAGKRLELLREIKPSLRTVGFLGSSRDPNATTFVQETRAAAGHLGLNLAVKLVEGPEAINESVFHGLRREGAEALVVQPIFTGHEQKIVGIAMSYNLPVVADFAVFAEAGALLTLGPDDNEQTVRAASYVDRILKGAKPAELPIEQPNTFLLVLNDLSAKKLGLTIPLSVLTRANRVIE
jgi:putative ABC transport system substrate-binding protein